MTSIEMIEAQGTSRITGRKCNATLERVAALLFLFFARWFPARRRRNGFFTGAVRGRAWLVCHLALILVFYFSIVLGFDFSARIYLRLEVVVVLIICVHSLLAVMQTATTVPERRETWGIVPPHLPEHCDAMG